MRNAPSPQHYDKKSWSRPDVRRMKAGSAEDGLQQGFDSESLNS